MTLFQSSYLEKVPLLVHLVFIDSNTIKGQDLALDLPKAQFECLTNAFHLFLHQHLSAIF